MAYGPYGEDPRQQSVPPMPPAWQQPASGPPASGPPMPSQAIQPYGQPVSGQPYPMPPQQPYPQQAPWGMGAGGAYDPLTGEPLSPKSKVVAGLLQIFLGGFGVGRFYTGHIGIAVGQICAVWGTVLLSFCFTLVTLGFGFPSLILVFVASLWPFIDGIMLLVGRQRDSDGYLLRS